MSKSSTLLRFTVILGLCFRFFLRGAVNRGSTALQADQGLKHKRLVSLKFNWNCYHIRVDELCKYEQDSNVKGKGWIY